ncbi:MAG: hypothetical protein WA632_12155 [Gallionella sp.]
MMNTADMLIYVHPELDTERRSQLASWVESSIGVDCAEFDRHAHPHALMVRYDPDAINGKQILNKVRKVDPIASIVGL